MYAHQRQLPSLVHVSIYIRWIRKKELWAKLAWRLVAVLERLEIAEVLKNRIEVAHLGPPLHLLFTTLGGRNWSEYGGLVKQMRTTPFFSISFFFNFNFIRIVIFQYSFVRKGAAGYNIIFNLLPFSTNKCLYGAQGVYPWICKVCFLYYYIYLFLCRFLLFLSQFFIFF